MQLTENTIHAVQILRYLHKHQSADKVLSIAKAVGISPQLCTRIMARLRPDGYITTVPNAPKQRSYYTLGRPAAEISFYDVFLALQGESCTTHCLKEHSECESGDCKLHKLLKTLQDNKTEDMLSWSIADLV